MRAQDPDSIERLFAGLSGVKGRAHVCLLGVGPEGSDHPSAAAAGRSEKSSSSWQKAKSAEKDKGASLAPCGLGPAEVTGASEGLSKT